MQAGDNPTTLTPSDSALQRPFTAEELKTLVLQTVGKGQRGPLSGMRLPSVADFQPLADALEHLRTTHLLQTGPSRAAQDLQEKFVKAYDQFNALLPKMMRLEASLIEAGEILGQPSDYALTISKDVPLLERVLLKDDEGSERARSRLEAMRALSAAMDALKEHLPVFRLNVSEDRAIPARRWQEMALMVWNITKELLESRNPDLAKLGIAQPAALFVQAVVERITGDSPTVSYIRKVLRDAKVKGETRDKAKRPVC